MTGALKDKLKNGNCNHSEIRVMLGTSCAAKPMATCIGLGVCLSTVNQPVRTTARDTSYQYERGVR